MCQLKIWIGFGLSFYASLRINRISYTCSARCGISTKTKTHSQQSTYGLGNNLQWRANLKSNLNAKSQILYTEMDLNPYLKPHIWNLISSRNLRSFWLNDRLSKFHSLLKYKISIISNILISAKVVNNTAVVTFCLVSTVRLFCMHQRTIH